MKDEETQEIGVMKIYFDRYTTLKELEEFKKSMPKSPAITDIKVGVEKRPIKINKEA